MRKIFLKAMTVIIMSAVLMTACSTNGTTENPDVTENPDFTKVPVSEPADDGVGEKKEYKAVFGLIDAAEYQSVGLEPDGSATYALSESMPGKDKWTEMNGLKAVAAGSNVTFGLKDNGRIAVTGEGSVYYDGVAEWADIIVLKAGLHGVAGVSSDGKGHLISSAFYDIETTVNGWSGLVSIDVSDTHVVALENDGTVVATVSGEGWSNDVGNAVDLNDWTDIIQVAAGEYFTAGLKSDGTVVIRGEYSFYVNENSCSDWEDIIMIDAGASHVVGLKSDGTAVAAGDSSYNQCDMSFMSGLISIAAGESHTIGLKADGSVVSAGYDEEGECNVESWLLKTN